MHSASDLFIQGLVTIACCVQCIKQLQFCCTYHIYAMSLKICSLLILTLLRKMQRDALFPIGLHSVVLKRYGIFMSCCN